jgi:hypothetical protein
MKLILSTVAALMLIGAVAAQPAQAACWWNGYGWQCWQPNEHRDRDRDWHQDRDWHHDHDWRYDR